MKLLVKSIGVIALLLLIGAAAIYLKESGQRKAVAETRQLLREQGFKTDLADFDFSISAEMQRREQALTNATYSGMSPSREIRAKSSLVQSEEINLMETIAPDAALVVWKQTQLPSREGEDLWPVLNEVFGEDKASFDAACEAVLSGRIRFGLNASHGSAMLLRHLSVQRTFVRELGRRAALELHDGNLTAAWTNLLTSTRLVTVWDVEPTEVSHMVQFACAADVFNTTWQALQTNAWTEDQLKQLQSEWESVDFFKGLPVTTAFSRACAVADCQRVRQRPLEMGMSYLEMIRSPRYGWRALTSLWQQMRYRQHGSFDDEKALLLHFRDRELEMRSAIKSPTWLVMRQLPSVTNQIFFQSKHPSQMQSILNMKQLAIGFAGDGHKFLEKAARAESLRRLVITAISLERHHRNHGNYPVLLTELVPSFLSKPPVDFMDGKTLRYRKSEAGHFVLWSVGLDGVDHGGRMLRRRLQPYQPFTTESRLEPQEPQQSDLLWPRPASAEDVEGFYKAQAETHREQLEEIAEFDAELRWEQTAWRQAQAEKLLQAGNPPQTANPMVNGQTLSERLGNVTATGTNYYSMTELLTLKQVVFGGEPETVTFELPINFDALTNLGSLHLYVDPAMPDNFDDGLAGCMAGWLECRRATNGNCLLVWNTVYEVPGNHFVQAGLWLGEDRAVDVVGPLATFSISNICQFSVESSVFNPYIGATLRAKLPEDNASFSADMISPDGVLQKTITGSTTNGVIKVFWDLVNDQGVRCANQSFSTIFRVTLKDSGRTQIIRGP
jgi:hypothetical protein